MSLELFYYPECPYCHRVLQVIQQLGIQNQIVLKNINTSAQDRQTLFQMNGHTQVPCLVIEGQPMLESADIIQYLKNAQSPRH